MQNKDQQKKRMTHFIFLFISFFASVIGCICGIGGGVIIKPVMDAFGLYSVSAVSFMSGCIVLSMTAYSVLREKLSHTNTRTESVGTYLGIGAAFGGLAGKQLFDAVKGLLANANEVGAVQAAALLLITLLTALYTVNREKIPSHRVKKPAACVLVGLALGLISAFLGIGGGPVNLVVLFYFFSMETKTAAHNSLYIILLSQIASLVYTVLCGRVPEVPACLLLCMVGCGILGGVVGRRINRKISSRTVDKLFLIMLVMIMGVCVYNFFLYV